MRKALFAEATPQGVSCSLCMQQCVLVEGERGPCGWRECADGELVTRASERLGRVVPRRIEALGLYHVLPGSRTLTVSFAGAAGEVDRDFHTYSIDELPDLARRAGCRSVSFGYIEPTFVIESLAPALEIARRARLPSILQTSAVMSAAAASFLAPRIAAVSVHVATMHDSTARREGEVAPHVLRENLQILRAAGVWIETSTLLVPGVNDSDEQMLEIALSLAAIDAAIPWHVRCIPGPAADGASDDGRLPSRWSDRAIERAVEAGARAGLEYVYAADAASSDRELTFCPVCRDVVLIERFQGHPRSFLAEGLRCPRCRTKAQGLFHPEAQETRAHPHAHAIR